MVKWLPRQKCWHPLLTGRIKIPEKISKHALINPDARLGEGVEVGPFAIIERNVTIGDGTRVDAKVHIKPYTKIGKNCRIFNSAVVGEIPQDLKFSGEKTELVIGDNTRIREFCTLNRGTSAGGQTKIGTDCLLMAYVHVAHDCVIGDNCILANGVQLGGHVEIGRYVTIGGMTPIHQFCKIGDHAFIGGGFRVVQDVPPYILAMGEPLKYAGLNAVGLRRRKFSEDIRTKMKKSYQMIFQSELNRSQAVKQIQKDFNSTPEINAIIDFIENSNRGLI